MRESVFISNCCALVFFSLTAMHLHAQSREWHTGERGIRFTENRGQIADVYGAPHPELRYTAGASDMSVYFMQDRISYVFVRHASNPQERATLLQQDQSTTSEKGSELIHVTVHPLPPVPTITPQATILTSSPAPRYQWNRDGVSIPGETRQMLGIGQPGSYTVTIIDSNGCRSTSIPHEHETEPTAALRLGAYEGEPGERVTIALEMTGSRNLARRNITRFSAHLRYRASLPSGLYTCVLQTPTMRVHQTLRIIH
jgi:hypothetical protein